VAAHAGIDAIYARFTQAYADLDAPRMGALYTEDALYLSPGGEIRQGRAAIEQGFARSFSRTWDAGETLHIRFEIVDRGIEGSLGYDVGYYHLNRTSKEGEVRSSTGKFVVVIHCEGPQGPCLFHVDGYSDVRPTPPATPPAAEADTAPPEAAAPSEPES
jgi:ketosteroid isomerase-like protein